MNSSAQTMLFLHHELMEKLSEWCTVMTGINKKTFALVKYTKIPWPNGVCSGNTITTRKLCCSLGRQSMYSSLWQKVCLVLLICDNLCGQRNLPGLKKLPLISYTSAGRKTPTGCCSRQSNTLSVCMMHYLLSLCNLPQVQPLIALTLHSPFTPVEVRG